MGANDNCDLCKQPLDFFDYYIFHVEHRNGPSADIEMTERYCRECVSVLGLDQHDKWMANTKRAKTI